MEYTRDELLLKEVIEEMGLVWDETAGNITVNGVPAVELLKSDNIFEDRNYYLMNPIEQVKSSDFMLDDKLMLVA